jgi:hypothetical protein
MMTYLKVLTPVVRLLANLSAGPESVAVCLALVQVPHELNMFANVDPYVHW